MLAWLLKCLGTDLCANQQPLLPLHPSPSPISLPEGPALDCWYQKGFNPFFSCSCFPTHFTNRFLKYPFCLASHVELPQFFGLP